MPSPSSGGACAHDAGGADARLMVKRLGRVDYEPALEAMRLFTAERTRDTPDEIWLLEHPPVYTLGQAGRPEHLLNNDAGIPLVKIDRGGQITYHGPGQLVVYLLLDLPRRRLKVRELVNLMEQAIIDTLADYGLAAVRKDGAPGVYIDGAKIAALGLRVKSGCSYHGLCLNVDADLTPFLSINPCGYEGLKTIRMRDFGIDETVQGAGECLLSHLQRLLPPPFEQPAEAPTMSAPP
ncbi:MAG: lipoyl(octanoyl) transferase LipB [Azoarcus sp.]|nr:lipoyl(octanoyl) transferase LipB [Azoarcus sp.]